MRTKHIEDQEGGTYILIVGEYGTEKWQYLINNRMYDNYEAYLESLKPKLDRFGEEDE